MPLAFHRDRAAKYRHQHPNAAEHVIPFIEHDVRVDGAYFNRLQDLSTEKIKHAEAAAFDFVQQPAHIHGCSGTNCPVGPTVCPGGGGFVGKLLMETSPVQPLGT